MSEVARLLVRFSRARGRAVASSFGHEEHHLVGEVVVMEQEVDRRSLKRDKGIV